MTDNGNKMENKKINNEPPDDQKTTMKNQKQKTINLQTTTLPK